MSNKECKNNQIFALHALEHISQNQSASSYLTTLVKNDNNILIENYKKRTFHNDLTYNISHYLLSLRW